MRPCPICHLDGGFHDNEEPVGHHAAARARIPPELTRPPNSATRVDVSQQRHERNQAYLREHAGAT